MSTPEPASAIRGSSSSPIAVVLIVLALVAILLTSGCGTRASAKPDGPADSPPPGHAVVTLATGSRSSPVPRSFFGVSTEYSEMPTNERNIKTFERVLALLRAAGGGPLVLRIGGDSVDRIYWQLRTPDLPLRVYPLTRRWLRSTVSIVRSARLRVILDMNLVADSPQMAASWARAALHHLPPGSVLGFEIGNEPDLPHRYWHHLWRMIARHKRRTTAPLPEADNLSSYARGFPRYAVALKRVAPQVALLGPAVANPGLHLAWLGHLIATERGLLGAVSVHRYPLSACVTASSPRYPTMARVLSERSSAGLASSLSGAVALAHRAGLGFRLTEVNSVTCGGRRGVSDTFATALWAPDALFELLRSGVDAVNVHVRAHAVNAPFGLAADGLHPRPLLYGLVMFVRALGRDARLLPLSLHAPGALDLKAWAIRVADRKMKVLLIDKSARAVTVDVRVRGRGAATVERLLAGSPSATSGVTLAGQTLGADGRWHGRAVIQMIARSRAGYSVTLTGFSAALITIGR